MFEFFKETGAERLLALADVLDVADEQHNQRGEPSYRQTRYVHLCGTPACAMGHYAATIGHERWELSPYLGLVNTQKDVTMQTEFGVSYEELGELFGATGCGDARDAKQAAAYIREFVRRKLSCAKED